MSFRVGFRCLLSLMVLVAALGGGPLPSASAAPATERWHRSVPGAWFLWSSPAVADVNGDGGNDVVVGALNGLVYAWDAAGNALPGWPARAIAAVASSPGVGDLDGDGANEVVVGGGSLEAEVAGQQGGVSVFNRDGTLRCNFATSRKHGKSGVFNAPAIGDVDGDGLNDVVFGSFDHGIYVLDRTCRQLALFDNTDSVFSAPALHDVDGDRTAEVFIGGDATRGQAGQSHDGGYFRSLKHQGGALVQRWVRTSTETFQNAGAIGDVNGDGRLEVITGSGAYYCRFSGRCADSNKVWAFHLDDGSDVPGWPKTATYSTFLAAPALGDIDGDGRTDVVVGSSQYVNRDPTKGQLDAFLGNGQRRTWPSPDLELVTPPVIADVNGAAPAEVVVGVAGEVFVLDGQLNVVQRGLAAGARGLGHKRAAVVGELGPGRWALVSAGFDPHQGNEGHVYAYDIPSPANIPWPQYRKNSRRLGADPTDLPIRCDTGYRLVAADGGDPPVGRTLRIGGVHVQQEEVERGSALAVPAGVPA